MSHVPKRRLTKNLFNYGLLFTTTTLIGSAIWVRWKTRCTENRYSPQGNFVYVDDLKLHYLEEGEGIPVILIHGNYAQASDFEASGLITLLAQKHRVIAFDRPGYGFSSRCHARTWTPTSQAELISRAVSSLGIKKAIVIGHGQGATVAAAMAINHPQMVDSMMLLSGYFYPTRRTNIVSSTLLNLPIIGSVLKNTIMPLIGQVRFSYTKKRAFSPRAISYRYDALVPYDLQVRPETIASSIQDSCLASFNIESLSHMYQQISQPVTIVTGDSDQINNPKKHSYKLHQQILQSQLKIVPCAGHMVHYVFARKICAWADDLNKMN